MSKKPANISAETLSSLKVDAIETGTAKAEPRVKSEKKTNITYFVSLTTHRRLKQHALDHNTSLQQILDEALDTYFAARGEPPIERIESARGKR
jgi:hypothetical protein